MAVTSHFTGALNLYIVWYLAKALCYLVYIFLSIEIQILWSKVNMVQVDFWLIDYLAPALVDVWNKQLAALLLPYKV